MADETKGYTPELGEELKKTAEVLKGKGYFIGDLAQIGGD